MYARDSFPGEHGHFFATLTETLENEALPLSWPVYDRRGLTDVKYVVENLEKALALPGGVWNFGSGNDQSTFDTVKSVLEGLGLEKGLGRLTPNVEAFAANPRDITMDQTKLRQAGIVFPTTAEGLRCCLAEWKQEKK
jgi:dTDP-4-dehydrorhamnose reductase